MSSPSTYILNSTSLATTDSLVASFNAALADAALNEEMLGEEILNFAHGTGEREVARKLISIINGGQSIRASREEIAKLLSSVDSQTLQRVKGLYPTRFSSAAITKRYVAEILTNNGASLELKFWKSRSVELFRDVARRGTGQAFKVNYYLKGEPLEEINELFDQDKAGEEDFLNAISEVELIFLYFAQNIEAAFYDMDVIKQQLLVERPETLKHEGFLNFSEKANRAHQLMVEVAVKIRESYGQEVGRGFRLGEGRPSEELENASESVYKSMNVLLNFVNNPFRLHENSSLANKDTLPVQLDMVLRNLEKALDDLG